MYKVNIYIYIYKANSKLFLKKKTKILFWSCFLELDTKTSLHLNLIIFLKGTYLLSNDSEQGSTVAAIDN